MKKKSSLKDALRTLETADKLKAALTKFSCALDTHKITLPESVSGDLTALRTAIDSAAKSLVGVSENRIQDALERAKKPLQ